MSSEGKSSGFSRSSSPSPCTECKEKCKVRYEERKSLIQSAKDKAIKEGGQAGEMATEVANRFAKYNEAMPRAKAAADVYDPQPGLAPNFDTA